MNVKQYEIATRLERALFACIKGWQIQLLGAKSAKFRVLKID